MTKAESKLKSFWPFSSPKYDEAADTFLSAAAQFKAASMWEESGDAQMRAADCFMKRGEKYAFCQAMTEAANCFKRVPTDKAKSSRGICLSAAIDGFIDQGRFNNAARLCRDSAEEEATDGNIPRALELYKRAFDFFTGENRTPEANKCLIAMAQLHASEQRKDYREAAAIFERVGTQMVEQSLGKFQAKDVFMNAALCRLAACRGDGRDEAILAAREAVDRYCGIDPRFGGTNEERLCRGLLAALDESDPGMVTSAAAEYDSVKRLDEWCASMLLAVREAVTPDLM